MVDSYVRRRLTTAVTAYRASIKARNAEERAAYARRLLERAAVHLASVKLEFRDQVHMLLAELQQFRSPWTHADRWAVVKAERTLRAQGVSTHTLARHLIRLGVCHGSGTAAVEACLVSMRKERQRYRQATGT